LKATVVLTLHYAASLKISKLLGNFRRDEGELQKVKCKKVV